MCPSPLLSIGIHLNSYEMKKNRKQAQNHDDDMDDPFHANKPKDPAKREQKKTTPDAVENPTGGVQNNPGEQNTG